jgi:hypothetical protein
MANGFNGSERHCVVMHSSGPEAGYCVRTGYVQADGTVWIPRPYTDVTPVKVYKREGPAQLLADKLNGRQGS